MKKHYYYKFTLLNSLENESVPTLYRIRVARNIYHLRLLLTCS